MQDDRVRLDGRGRSPFLPSGAKQDQRRVFCVDVDGDCAATRRADDDIGLVLIEFGLADANGYVEVVIWERRVNDGVAVVFEVGRFCAARCRSPAVEIENLHRVCVLSEKRPSPADFMWRRSLVRLTNDA